MSVSRRLRFEIFRRDNHTCGYCGATAPDAKLTVDHVVPTALGGSDAPDNLVAACSDCNGGKTSVAPGAPLVADVAQSALAWSRAIRTAAAQMLADTHARHNDQQAFLDAWTEGDPCGWAGLPDNWRDSIDRFTAAGLPMTIVLDAVRRTFAARQVGRPQKFRYMCGIAWARVSELQDAARSLTSIGAEESADVDEEDCGCNGASDVGVSILWRLSSSERQAAMDAAECLSRRTYDDDVAQAACCAVDILLSDRAGLDYAAQQLMDALPESLRSQITEDAYQEAYATRAELMTDADVLTWKLRILAARMGAGALIARM